MLLYGYILANLLADFLAQPLSVFLAMFGQKGTFVSVFLTEYYVVLISEFEPVIFAIMSGPVYSQLFGWTIVLVLCS